MSVSQYRGRMQARYYVLTRRSMRVGLLSHIVFLVLFAVFGIWPMVLINVGSIGLYVAANRWADQGHGGRSLVAATIEGIIHAIAAILTVGVTSGFHYYLFVRGAGAYLADDARPRHTNIVIGSAALAFVASIVFAPEIPPFAFPPLVDGALGVINLGLVFAMLGFVGWNYRASADAAEAEIATERQRADDLLTEILPSPIAERLKNDPGTIADWYDSASVLFADVVGFSSYVERSQPEEVVETLHQMFGAFDAEVASRHLEKIKTIGDAYMAAGGVPEGRSNDAHAIVSLARSMVDIASGLGHQLRVGIATGPLMAGVVGETKFHYDVWGNTVNLASRLENAAEPGQILLSKEFAAQIEDRWFLTERGPYELKGLGTVTAFELGGEHSQTTRL